jgi:hypothetical protein
MHRFCNRRAGRLSLRGRNQASHARTASLTLTGSASGDQREQYNHDEEEYFLIAIHAYLPQRTVL